MDPSALPHSLDQLLAQRTWLRRLARSLVADPHGADDLEQDVWLRAIQKAPDTVRSPRGWLGTLTRRAAIDTGRADTRRRRRESSVAATQAARSTTELATEADTCQQVTRAVLDLAEPYRSTVLLRYAGGNPLAEVARLQGVPVETVRTRLRRALSKLRDRLDARHGGDRKAWRAALLPLAGGLGPTATTAVTAGGIAAMSSKLIISLSIVAAGILGLVLWQPWTAAEPPPIESSDTDTPGSDTAGTAQGHTPELAGRSEPGTEHPEPGTAGGPNPGASDAPAHKVSEGEAGASGVIGGVVRTATGDALVNADVFLWSEDGRSIVQRVRTDAEGAFRFDKLDDGRRVVSFHIAGHPPLSHRAKVGGRMLDVTMAEAIKPTVGPPPTITGTLLTEDARTPLAGVRIRAQRLTPAQSPAFAAATTDEQGRFALRVPTKGKYALSVGQVAGEVTGPTAEFLPKRVEPIQSGTDDVEILLSRGLVIAGQIRGAGNEPWTGGARVRASPISAEGAVDYSRQRSAQATEDGTFRLPGLLSGAYDLTVEPVVASEAEGTRGIAHVARIPAGTVDLIVDLPAGKPLTGQLQDEEGTPVMGKGWVWVSPIGTSAGEPGSITATLDEKGGFTTPPLDPGRAHAVSAAGFEGHGRGQLPSVFPGDDNIVVTLPSGFRLTVHVLDASSGAPVGPGVPILANAVDLAPEDVMEPWARARTNTVANKAVILGGMKHRAYWMRAGGAGSGYVPAEAPKRVEPTAKSVVLRVVRGVALSGRVLDADGEGVASVRLEAKGAAGSAALCWTGADGRFRFEGVEPGEITLTGSIDGARHVLGRFKAPSKTIEAKLP